MVKLFIDTTNNSEVVAQIKTPDTFFEERSTSGNKRPESILLLIQKVCKEANIDLNDIDEIEVNEGPGSYTGIKVGVSVANALSFSLQKKVNGHPLGELIEPKYE